MMKKRSSANYNDSYFEQYGQDNDRKKRVAHSTSAATGFQFDINSKIAHNIRQTAYKQILKFVGSAEKAGSIERELYGKSGNVAEYRAKFLVWKREAVERNERNEQHAESKTEQCEKEKMNLIKLILNIDEMVANGYPVLDEWKDVDYHVVENEETLPNVALLESHRIGTDLLQKHVLVAKDTTLKEPALKDSAQSIDLKDEISTISPEESEVLCDRCKLPISSSSTCRFHPGKRWKRGRDFSSIVYNCCGGIVQSEPCESFHKHVFSIAKLSPAEQQKRFSYWALPPIAQTSPSSFTLSSEFKGNAKDKSSPLSSAEAFGVYAMDCEMVYLNDGSSCLARVSVADYFSRKCVVDALVEPVMSVLDYNTRYSGITAECFLPKCYNGTKESDEFANNLKGCDTNEDATENIQKQFSSTKELSFSSININSNSDSFIEINEPLKIKNSVIFFDEFTSNPSPPQFLTFSTLKQLFCRHFSQNDIFIGHSLENDLVALHLQHRRVIDTAVLFMEHSSGRKFSLERLTSWHCKRFIQDAVVEADGRLSKGHDSVEDAVACISLVEYYLENELDVSGRI